MVRLQVLPGVYAVARLSPEGPIPDWAEGSGFVSISRSDDELSIVCLEERVVQGVQKDGGWRCLKFVGPFAFDETGIVLSVIEPLSRSDIGVFVVSSFDGDHLLLKGKDLSTASVLLENAGHRFV